MFTVNTYGGRVRVYMGEIEYQFTDASMADRFVYELGRGVQSVATLVERFMNFLTRVTERVVNALVKLARILADSDNYRRGKGAASYREVQRYFSIS